MESPPPSPPAVAAAVPPSPAPLAEDLVGAVVRPPSIRVPGASSYQSNLSGRLTPRSSPSFRKSSSLRGSSSTPQSGSRFSSSLPLSWYHTSGSSRRRRFLPWLVVLGLWAYMAFLLQSRWAPVDSHASLRLQLPGDLETENYLTLFEHNNDSSADSGLLKLPTPGLRSPELPGVLETENHLLLSEHNNDSSAGSGLQKLPTPGLRSPVQKNKTSISWDFPSVGTMNESFGTLVGPFGETEKLFFGQELEMKPKCGSKNSSFARLAKGRRFLLIFHELSMTGAPLAMMELATEIKNCGGDVSAVALSQKGGLLDGLLGNGIRVLKSKTAQAFRFATRADLVIAGSAVCASWIADAMQKKGPKRLVWWIMENRQEYFDRSKHILHFAKALIFLSESQLKQWKIWSAAEHIVLPDIIKVVSLSVNKELILKSGLGQEEDILQKRQNMRQSIRMKMGLMPQDVLFSILSSINPGKGQLRLLQAVAMVVEGLKGYEEGNINMDSDKIGVSKLIQTDQYQGRLRLLIGSVGSKSDKVDYVRKLLQFISDHPRLADVILWTPATVQVASLYAASDVYVMNSQGIGETFGRVTVEAMAFSLPILGTNAGGTPEIVDEDINGMLHPVGVKGIGILAKHMSTLTRNATLRKRMGSNGSRKVQKYYLKDIMYDNLSDVFLSCMR